MNRAPPTGSEEADTTPDPKRWGGSEDAEPAVLVETGPRAIEPPWVPRLFAIADRHDVELREIRDGRFVREALVVVMVLMFILVGLVAGLTGAFLGFLWRVA